MRRYVLDSKAAPPNWSAVRVVLVGKCYLECPVCGKLRGLQLRRMASGEVRNQPRCGPCRRKKLGKKKRGAARAPRRFEQLQLF